MKIIVTSKNPVKRAATEKAFQLMFPHTPQTIEEIAVPSDVHDQPMSEEETLQGAKNRVANAIKRIPAADDMVFKQKNTKQKMGTIGTLTNNIIDRTGYYKPAVIFALIPFVNSELY